jgi:hypothetical protein
VTAVAGASVEAGGVEEGVVGEHCRILKCSGEKKRVGGRLKMAQVWGLTSRSSSRQRVQKTDGKEGHRFAFRVAGTTPLLLSEVIHRPGRLPGLRPPPPLQPRTWARARAA